MTKKRSPRAIPILFAICMFAIFAGLLGLYLMIHSQLEGTLDRDVLSILIIGTVIFSVFMLMRLTSRRVKREFGDALDLFDEASDGEEPDLTEKSEFTFDELKRLSDFVRSKKSIDEHAKQQRREYRHLQKELSKTNDEYYSSISYEVRTLINSVMGFSDLLKGTPIDDEQVDYLNSIRESGQILMILLNDVLDISKLEVGERKIEKGVFDFPKLIDDVIESLAAKTKRKALHVNVVYGQEIPRYLVGDKERVRRVLFNMMQSVISVARRGEMSLRVESSVKQGDDDCDMVTVGIHVDRLAVPKDKIESMVRVFSGESETIEGKYSGIGLRVFIVQQLIHFLGGDLSVLFKEGKGCDFIVGFEFDEVGSLSENGAFAEESQDEQGGDEQNVVDLTGRRIMVAEDNDINQKLLKVVLEKRNCSVDLVSTGYEAVEQIIMNDYDVVIMDIKMPLMNGIDVTRFIRKELRKKTPIIALTAVARETDEADARAAGMNDFLVKPIDTPLLLKKIDSWTNGGSDKG